MWPHSCKCITMISAGAGVGRRGSNDGTRWTHGLRTGTVCVWLTSRSIPSGIAPGLRCCGFCATRLCSNAGLCFQNHGPWPLRRAAAPRSIHPSATSAFCTAPGASSVSRRRVWRRRIAAGPASSVVRRGPPQAAAGPSCASAGRARAVPRSRVSQRTAPGPP